jgi:SnoaL-like domain
MNPTVMRMAEAINRHDPEGMAAQMAPDYRSEQPIHPNRRFGGNRQVVENWTAILGAVPDLVVDVLRESTDGSTSWSEWWMHGHKPDGTPHELRGVIIAGLGEDGLIQWQRLYVEPVEEGGADIRASVRETVRDTERAPA